MFEIGKFVLPFIQLNNIRVYCLMGFSQNLWMYFGFCRLDAMNKRIVFCLTIPLTVIL